MTGPIRTAALLLLLTAASSATAGVRVSTYEARDDAMAAAWAAEDDLIARWRLLRAWHSERRIGRKDVVIPPAEVLDMFLAQARLTVWARELADGFPAAIYAALDDRRFATAASLGSAYLAFLDHAIETRDGTPLEPYLTDRPASGRALGLHALAQLQRRLPVVVVEGGRDFTTWHLHGGNRFHPSVGNARLTGTWANAHWLHASDVGAWVGDAPNWGVRPARVQVKLGQVVHGQEEIVRVRLLDNPDYGRWTQELQDAHDALQVAENAWTDSMNCRPASTTRRPVSSHTEYYVEQGSGVYVGANLPQNATHSRRVTTYEVTHDPGGCEAGDAGAHRAWLAAKEAVAALGRGGGTVHVSRNEAAPRVRGRGGDAPRDTEPDTPSIRPTLSKASPRESSSVDPRTAWDCGPVTSRIMLWPPGAGGEAAGGGRRGRGAPPDTSSVR